jgi:hypothetical protein
MPEVLVALYYSYGTADAVRAALVADGFPTDRVELTSQVDEGQAGALPAEAFSGRISQYFETLFEGEDGGCIEFFTEGLKRGGAVVAVHPRGAEEVERATAILQRHKPIEIEGRNLDAQRGDDAPSDQPGRTA